MLIKIQNNHRFQTYKICNVCADIFGPLNTLTQRFCSKNCGYDWQISKPKKPRMKLNKRARSIQRRSQYLIKSGKIKKADSCDECGSLDKIEIAHYNYVEADRFRQLCISCHRKWDIRIPKYTGKEAKLDGNSKL